MLVCEIDGMKQQTLDPLKRELWVPCPRPSRDALADTTLRLTQRTNNKSSVACCLLLRHHEGHYNKPSDDHRLSIIYNGSQKNTGDQLMERISYNFSICTFFYFAHQQLNNEMKIINTNSAYALHTQYQYFL